VTSPSWMVEESYSRLAHAMTGGRIGAAAQLYWPSSIFLMDGVRYPEHCRRRRASSHRTPQASPILRRMNGQS